MRSHLVSLASWFPPKRKKQKQIELLCNVHPFGNYYPSLKSFRFLSHLLYSSPEYSLIHVSVPFDWSATENHKLKEFSERFLLRSTSESLRYQNVPNVKTRRKEDLLECPICWESFNLVENIPHVLWCGHTICKNCTIALRWATVKFQAYLIKLPFFISCPWCQMLSFRLVWKGNLSFPHKNYFLLWLVESVNCDQMRSYSSAYGDQGFSSLGNFQCPQSDVLLLLQHRGGHSPHQSINNGEIWRFHVLVSKMTGMIVRLTAKFPVVLIFLFVLLYIIPASVAILAAYLLVTVLFAFPSFLVLYFSYPILDWLLREIATGEGFWNFT